MPPIGPNFTRVAVGPDDNGENAMFVNGKSDIAKAEEAIAITWVYAEDVADGDGPTASRSEESSHRLAAFDPNGAADWTVTVTEGELPDVDRYVLLMGVATMPPGGDGPATIRWSQNFQVEQK